MSNKYIEIALKLNGESEGHFPLCDDHGTLSIFKKLVISEQFNNLCDQDKYTLFIKELVNYDIISTAVEARYTYEKSCEDF